MEVKTQKELKYLLNDLTKERDTLIEITKLFNEYRADFKIMPPEKAERIIYSLKESYDICSNNIESTTQLLNSIDVKDTEVKNTKSKKKKSKSNKKSSNKNQKSIDFVLVDEPEIKPDIKEETITKESPTKKRKHKDFVVIDEPEEEKNEESNDTPIIEQKDEFEDNTLLISEKNNKVILPYRYEDLYKVYEENKDSYSSVQDIIDKDYTIPYSFYKNAPIARFKEAFKLMKNRQKSTTKEAFDLATEMMTNYNVHPAIISACKNIDELDIYLDYLENNEVEKFDIFKIKFDILLKKVKSRGKRTK